MCSLLLAILWTLASAQCLAVAPSSIDPYPWVHGGAHSAAKVAASPDPLVDYRWDLATLADPFAYQSFTDLPVSASAEPAASFEGLATVASTGSTVHVRGQGVITVKFAQEAGANTSPASASGDLVAVALFRLG